MRSSRLVPLISICLILSSPRSGNALDLWEAASRADDINELRRTWDRAELRVPGHLIGPDTPPIYGYLGAEYVQRRLAMLPRDVRVPVVVFLHGCTGIGLVENKVGRLLDQAGYAVLLPNSFARDVRERNCDYSNYSSGMFPVAYLYRRAELISTVQHLRSLDWVDQDRIWLGGFSEGAVATALWGGEVDVSGYIIAGWTCTAPPQFGWLIGLRTPPSRPVLAIVSRWDPWFNWPGWQGDCGTMAADRNNVVSVLIDGSVHNVFAYPESTHALLDFLRDQAMPE